MVDFRRMIRLVIRQEILLRVAGCTPNDANLSPPCSGELEQHSAVLAKSQKKLAPGYEL